MRQILVDYARYRDAELALIDSGLCDLSSAIDHDTLALDLALSELEGLDPQAAQLVMLRFFGGLAVDEAAEVLEIAPRTAAHAWTRARAFLKSRLDS